MRVCLATYQSAMLLKGGPRTQILQTKRCLEQLGVEVSLFESWKEFDRRSVDLFHLIGANIGTYHLAREVHKLGIPMIVTPIFYTRHSHLLVRSVVSVDKMVRGLLRGAWTDFGLMAEICSWAKAVLPNTHKEALLFEKGMRVPRDKIAVVPNGVEERFYDSRPDAFVKAYGIDKFILNVGHIGPARKNVLRLIRALSTIDHPAVIIGRYDDTPEGRQCLQEAKNNRRLKVVDSLPNDSELLASAYAACDVFVLPSLFETPGIAALEAALAGAKIVVTSEGGTEEYFGSHAEYVDPASVESIREGILTGLKKERDGTLRELVRRDYLWERVAEKTREIYQRVI